MAQTNPKSLGIGAVLGVSFVAVLVLIFMPVFGGGMNGLDYADDLFNKLSKGSSYFIPKLQKSAQGSEGKAFTATVSLDTPETAALATKLLAAAGATVQAEGKTLRASGDLGRMLGTALADADDMYHNRGKAVAERYGAKEKDALRAWWGALSQMDKAFKRDGRVEDAKAVSEVMKRAVETAYNYYGVEPVKVADKALLMTSLLVFYVAYTMWWGFAIFFIFEGFGLTMKKAKVKKEV